MLFPLSDPAVLSFGEGSGEIYLSIVSCDGNESSISECNTSLDFYYSHSEDAGVSCLKSMIAQHATYSHLSSDLSCSGYYICNSLHHHSTVYSGYFD